MATNPQIGRFNRPQSLAQLTRGRGWNSELTGFLLPLAVRNYFYEKYDFHNATISPDWAVSNSGGAGAADYAVNALEMGTVRGTTGTTDNGSVEIHFGMVMFDAARNPGMEVASKFDVVTGHAFEMAFADAPSTASTLNVSALTAGGVPTIASNGVTDQAGIVLNTDLTLATAAVYSKGTTDAASGDNLGTFAPGAATYFLARIQVRANGVYAIINDDPAQAETLVLGPDTGILMRPHVISATKNTTTKLHDIDYIRLWAERSY